MRRALFPLGPGGTELTAITPAPLAEIDTPVRNRMLNHSRQHTLWSAQPAALPDVRGQSLPGREQFLFIDDVVTIKHGARLVTGEQHRHTFWHPRSNEIPRRRATAVMEQTMRDLSLPASVA